MTKTSLFTTFLSLTIFFSASASATMERGTMEYLEKNFQELSKEINPCETINNIIQKHTETLTIYLNAELGYWAELEALYKEEKVEYSENLIRMEEWVDDEGLELIPARGAAHLDYLYKLATIYSAFCKE